jgi:hypothetical protein
MTGTRSTSPSRGNADRPNPPLKLTAAFGDRSYILPSLVVVTANDDHRRTAIVLKTAVADLVRLVWREEQHAVQDLRRP